MLECGILFVRLSQVICLYTVCAMIAEGRREDPNNSKTDHQWPNSETSFKCLSVVNVYTLE